MSAFLFTLTIIPAVLGGSYYLVIPYPYHQQLESAMNYKSVEIKAWNFTSFPVEDLKSLELSSETTKLTFTKVSITPTYFHELIAKFSALTELELNDVSFQSYDKRTCSCIHRQKLKYLTIHTIDLQASKNIFSELKCVMPEYSLDLDNSPQYVTQITENLKPDDIPATLSALSLINCGLEEKTFLTVLKLFPKVEWLRINSNKIGAGFVNWEPMAELRTLQAENTSMTPNGLFHVIQSFPKLETFFVTGDAFTEFTDKQLKDLQKYSRKTEQPLRVSVAELANGYEPKFCDINTEYLYVNCFKSNLKNSY